MENASQTKTLVRLKVWGDSPLNPDYGRKNKRRANEHVSKLESTVQTIFVGVPDFETKSTVLGTNISPFKGLLKIIFLFFRWDMLVPWRVTSTSEFFLG